MHDWQAGLRARLQAGAPTVSVTCVEVQGSAPCAVGSRMLVGAEDFEGTIGGGNLEFLALKQARKLLAGSNSCLRQSLPLGPLLSQCCGGRVTLFYEKFHPSDISFFEAACASAGSIVTRCGCDDFGKWLLEDERVTAMREGMEPVDLPAIPERSFDGLFYCEPAALNLPQVCIFGAGHIGEALAKVLQVARCKIVLIDPRDDMAPALPKGADWLKTDDPTSLGEWWQSGAIAIVLTHSHDLDFAWVSAILRRGDSKYCGLIGSRTKRTRFIRRLLSDGFSEEQVSHLTCPIGSSDLKSKDPGAVAIAAAAQILPFLAALSKPGAARSCDCTAPGDKRHLKVRYAR